MWIYNLFYKPGRYHKVDWTLKQPLVLKWLQCLVNLHIISFKAKGSNCNKWLVDWPFCLEVTIYLYVYHTYYITVIYLFFRNEASCTTNTTTNAAHTPSVSSLQLPPIHTHDSCSVDVGNIGIKHDLQSTKKTPRNKQERSVTEPWMIETVATLVWNRLPLSCLQSDCAFIVTEQVAEDSQQYLGSLSECLAQRNQILVSGWYSCFNVHFRYTRKILICPGYQSIRYQLVRLILGRDIEYVF